MDVFKYLKKVNPNEIKNLDSYGMLPSGYVTDGLGSIYKVPAVGKTPKFKVDSIEGYLFQYDWGEKEIAVFSYNPDTKDQELVESFGISSGNFVDGPEYWAKVAYENIQDDVSFDIVNEGLETTKGLKMNFSIEQLRGFERNKQKFIELINNYHVEETIYDNIYKISAQVDANNLGTLYIKGDTDLLSDSDCREIFSKFAKHMTVLGMQHKFGHFELF